MTPQTTTASLGQRYDEIAERMDAAYAERAQHQPRTPEYLDASEAIDAVYADLRVLNKEAGAL